MIFTIPDQDYADDDEFTNALNAVIGEDESIQYGAVIFKHTVYYTKKVSNVLIKTSAGRSAISNFCQCYFYCSRDYCIYWHPEGTYELTAQAPGYEIFSGEVTVYKLQTTVLDIIMTPTTDP